jgi:integrase/recombinase XerD
MLSIYRRHQKGCPHGRKKRRYWLCRCPIWFDGRIRGQRIHQSMHLVDWDDAQRLAEQWIRTEKILGGLAQPELTLSSTSNSCLLPLSENRHTLEDAWDQFEKKEKERNLSTATIYKYGLLRRQMEAFAARRGLRFLQDFRLDILEMFQSEWRESAVTRSKKLERLKAFFRTATARAGIDDNPALLLKGPKLEPNPTRPFTKSEMSRILAAIERYPDKSGRFGRPNASRLRAFVLTLRYSGLRIGDVTSLHVERLDGSKIFLYSQKTGVPVYCVLPPFVAEALATILRLSENYFFWTGASKLHTAVGTWQRTLKKLFNLAAVPTGHAHRFRDTFSVELLLAGVPIEDVSILLGHCNIEITQNHYAPWVRDRQVRLEADLQRAWNSDPLVQQEALREKNRNLTRGLPN